jgi:hypothetical protein
VNNPALAAENDLRLLELVELVRERVVRLGPAGGEVQLRVRVEHGGRISRLVKVTVEELLPAERE